MITEKEKEFINLIHRGASKIDAFISVFGGEKTKENYKKSSYIASKEESKTYFSELSILHPSTVSILKELEDIKNIAYSKNDPATMLRCLVAKISLIESGVKETSLPKNLPSIEALKELKENLLSNAKEVVKNINE